MYAIGHIDQYERNELRALLSGGKSPARKLNRAKSC